MKIKYTVRDIVESAMLVALAIVLDLQGLKIQLSAAGGSISFTMVPLIILCLRQGPFKGFIGCGIVYGLITCLIDGHNFICFPFDYLLAYGSVAVIGFYSNLILDEKHQVRGILFLILGIINCIVLRFVFHTISSLVIFEYSFKASIIYNVGYVGISGAVCLITMLLLFKPLLIINSKFKIKSID